MIDYLASFVNTDGVAFPNTAAKNATSPGATDGTEFVKLMVDDVWGARQALMDYVGLVPDGVTEAPGTSQKLEALKLLIGGDKIQPATASVAANALTVTLNPTFLDFRSPTLSSGVVTTVDIPSAISLVISSGSTLGTINAIQSRIAILAIDNAGTIELAAVNIAGGNNLDETTLITTVAEGGAGAADSANVIYSTTARTNVPFRVVGYVESTQAVAGTWATTLSTTQGYGGQAMAAMGSIGYGQTLQDVTVSRSAGVTYYNTTGKPIFIAAALTSTSVSTCIATVNGVDIIGTTVDSSDNSSIQLIIPPGASYSVTMSLGTPSVNRWIELR